MTELFTENLILERTLADIFQQMGVTGETPIGVGQTFISPNIIGGIMQGTSFRSGDGGARIEIFPEWDKTIGLIAYDNAGSQVFKMLVGGTDVGDIIMGDTSGNYTKWDKSAGTITVHGATVSNPTITGIQSGSEISIQGWQHDMAFSATDHDTVAWASGTITLLDGTTYNITGANTSTMSAITYIYLDIGTSITVLQTTTTATTAVGTGKIIIAVAQNVASGNNAIFQVFGGKALGGMGKLIVASDITADAITANEIAANTITAAQMNVSILSAISANLGTVTIGRFGDYKVVVSSGDDVQAAIDSIGAGGGTVFLTAGTYTLSDDLTIPSNLVLQGEGMGVVILYFQTLDKGIKVQGTSNYSTGTLSISNGSTAVVGSGTSWDGNVTTNHKIKLENFWYDVSVVTDDTHITISAKYLGVTLSGATYDSAVMATNFTLKDLTVYLSGGNGIYIDYGHYFYIEKVTVSTCTGDGISINNSTSCSIHNCVTTDNTSDGVSLTNVDHIEFDVLWTMRNGAQGINANNVADSEYENVVARNNVDGIYFDTCGDIIVYACDLSNNSSQGIEAVSTNRIGITSTEFQNNTSDGLKLTSNCDEWRVGQSNFKDNGGYGINIAASTDDNNNITGNIYSGNASGDINDAGSGTIADVFRALGIFGDGSDGDVDINSGTFSSGPITSNVLTRDAYFDDLTLSGGNLDIAGYRLFVKGTLTMNSSYKIERDGNAGTSGGNGANATSGGAGAGGSAGSAGAALGAGSIQGAVAGKIGIAGGAGAADDGTGSNGASGGAGNDSAKSIGSAGVAGAAGGAGGDSSTSGGSAGGAGSAGSQTGTVYNRPYNVTSVYLLYDVLPSADYLRSSSGSGGSGSGGGGSCSSSGGSVANAGGGGGSGGSGSPGGIVVVFARKIVNNGTISANGGSGGNGGDGGDGYASQENSDLCGAGGGGGAAGGSGGSGGVVLVIYNSKTGSGTITATAGVAGTAGTGGTGVSLGKVGDNGANGNAGNAGNAGVIIELQF